MQPHEVTTYDAFVENALCLVCGYNGFGEINSIAANVLSSSTQSSTITLPNVHSCYSYVGILKIHRYLCNIHTIYALLLKKIFQTKVVVLIEL